MKMRLRTATPFPKDASARPLGKKAVVGWKGCRPRLAVRARHIRRGGLDGVCQLNGAFGDLVGTGSEVLGALLADKNESRGSEQHGTEQDHHENVSETPFPKDAPARPLGKKADVGWKGNVVG